MDEGIVSPVELSEFIRLKMLDGVAMKPSRCGGLAPAKRQIEILRNEGLMWLGSGLSDPDISIAASLALYSAYGLTKPAALNGPQFLTTDVLTRNGWIIGEVHAGDVISMGLSQTNPVKPVIEVNIGDQVVFKLKSSDVVHGFSLKDFNIFITDGIQPGKAVLVSFVADKTGTFIFSCNAICGDNHQNMQGTLIVRA